MKVRDLLVLTGNEARVAAYDRHANLTTGLHPVTGTMRFVQYLIGGAIEGTFQIGKGGEALTYSATVWGPGVGSGAVKGAGTFVRPPEQLLSAATLYVACDAEVLEVAWFDEDDTYLGFFAGRCSGISVGAQVAAGAFARPASAAM